MVGVSTDRQEISDRFAAELGLPFPLVGDPKGKVAKAWGVKWPLIPLARRVTYLVGRDRRIRLVLDERDPDRHVAGACAAAAAPEA